MKYIKGTLKEPWVRGINATILKFSVMAAVHYINRLAEDAQGFNPAIDLPLLLSLRQSVGVPLFLTLYFRLIWAYVFIVPYQKVRSSVFTRHHAVYSSLYSSKTVVPSKNKKYAVITFESEGNGEIHCVSSFHFLIFIISG
jgi:hypothetical protein